MKLNGKDILKQAQPHFETFKALFTHGVLGISHSGRPIWVMKVPLTSLPTWSCRRSSQWNGERAFKGFVSPRLGVYAWSWSDHRSSLKL